MFIILFLMSMQGLIASRDTAIMTTAHSLIPWKIWDLLFQGIP